MRIKTLNNAPQVNKHVPLLKKEESDVLVVADKVELRDDRNQSDKFLSLPGKIIDYTKARHYITEDGVIHEVGDWTEPKENSAAIGGAIKGYLFAGGPVGLLSGALGGYAGTRIGKATKSDMGAIVGGAAAGAATGVVTTIALGALINGSAPGGALLDVAILSGLAGATGTLSGHKYAGVRDGLYGGMVTGGVARAITGYSGLALAGVIGGGVGGNANTAAGKVILGGGAGAATGAVTAIPALVSMGTAGLPILGISAAAGAIAGAGGALIGPVITRPIRNVTMDICEQTDKKIDKIYENKKPSKTTKVLAGAGMGVLMIAPFGYVFGGVQGAAIGAAAGAIVMGGKTFYDKVIKSKKKEEEKPLSQEPQLSSS